MSNYLRLIVDSDDQIRPYPRHLKANVSAFIHGYRTAPPSPGEDYAIVENESGDVITAYGDINWDLWLYQITASKKESKLNFERLPPSGREEAKWLMFVLLFMAEPLSGTQLTVSTVTSYMKVVGPLAFFTNNENYSLLKLFNDPAAIRKFLESPTNMSMGEKLCSLVSHLNTIGYERCGIEVVTPDQYKKLYQKPPRREARQHAVIPPRLLSELITQLNILLREVATNIEQLCDLVRNMAEDPALGRRPSAQRNAGRLERQFSRQFEEAAVFWELDELFNRYEITGPKKLRTFLTRIQHACRLMLTLYSGMRKGEIDSLKCGCLKQDRTSNQVFYRLEGSTTKLHKMEKFDSWMTSVDVKEAVIVAENLALTFAEISNIDDADGIPLFLCSRFSRLNRTAPKKKGYLDINHCSGVGQQVFDSLPAEPFLITPEDIAHLNLIDPFRPWKAEEKFDVGRAWQFKNHQIRRTLAYLVGQSLLVSLPSIKRQYKHLAPAMTLYYMRSEATDPSFESSNHFCRLLNDKKPEADAIAYYNDILNSKEPLLGAYGKFLEKRGKKVYKDVVFTTPRNELVKRMRKGLEAYSETPLGACTFTGRCDKRAMRSLTECLSCKSAVIKPSKLRNLIQRQEAFVEELTPGSLEHRTEQAELNTLEKFQKQSGVQSQ